MVGHGRLMKFEAGNDDATHLKGTLLGVWPQSPWNPGIIAGAILGLLASSNSSFWARFGRQQIYNHVLLTCLPVVYQLFTSCC